MFFRFGGLCLPLMVVGAVVLVASRRLARPQVGRLEWPLSGKGVFDAGRSADRECATGAAACPVRPN